VFVCGTIIAAAVWLLAAGAARAQDAGALPPGVRAGAAEVPVVGGNSAGARERALDEALRQVVGQALGELLDPQTRTAQARSIKAVQARARSYVKRYRTVEEKEANGVYSVRIEAEVDDAALRRAAEKWTAGPPAPTGSTAGRPAVPSLMLVVSGPADAGPALAGALSSAGIKARLSDPALSDPSQAVAAAAKASLSGVAFVSATVADDGTVRGPGQTAVSCQLAVKVVSAPAAQPMAEETTSLRSFGDREPAARADCLTRAAAAIAPRLVPAGSRGGGGGGELRAVTLDADVVEPPVVAALLKVVRGLGSVSAAEVRRIVPGRAMLQVRTRLMPPALAAVLARETSGPILLSDFDTAGDRIRFRARLRPAPVPAAPPAPPAASPPSPPANP
jgi:hypothetical protein